MCPPQRWRQMLLRLGWDLKWLLQPLSSAIPPELGVEITSPVHAHTRNLLITAFQVCLSPLIFDLDRSLFELHGSFFHSFDLVYLYHYRVPCPFLWASPGSFLQPLVPPRPLLYILGLQFGPLCIPCPMLCIDSTYTIFKGVALYLLVAILVISLWPICFMTIMTFFFGVSFSEDTASCISFSSDCVRCSSPGVFFGIYLAHLFYVF